ncbi:hypothetical protein EIP86_005389 [Pleurotus ostreatoroseus]|nr:hypothetical protein EIP86_005389 [Pleurotus ostreatoroseus]
MSVRRSLGSRQHAIPADVIWLDFPRTDGDNSSWPKNQSEVVDSEGHVNFMRPMSVDENTGVLWRKVVGKFVAQKLGKPGSSNALRFRSANEFAPHAAWLFLDASLSRANCECKYCAKKPQREVTQQLGLSTSKRASDSPAPITRREKRPREAPKAPQAAVRRAPKPPKPRLTGPQQWMVPEKNNDVRDALGRHEGKATRYFRKGELVWCAIHPAIGVSGQAPSIAFWPGLVDVCTTIPEIIHRVEQGANVDPAVSASRSPSPTSQASPQIAWSVHQHVSYKIKLLATSSSILLNEDQVLPYLAYAPSDQLLDVLRKELPNAVETPAVEELEEQEQKMFAYDPCAVQDEQMRFTQAIAPYTLAIHIASKMATFWTPTDEWECKFTAPSSPSKPPAAPSTSTNPEPTLDAVLNSVLAQNSQMPESSASASQAAPGVENRILGNTPSGPQTVTQMRYQGLWWGAERIWTDELVRLKLARCQFVPQGSDVVQAPAGISESTKAWNAERGVQLDDNAGGAGERGLFMLLEGLFVVEVSHPESGGTVKECRASGMLYELVDEDWKPPVAGEGARADTPAAPDAQSNGVPNDVPMSISPPGTQPATDALPTGGSISAPPIAPASAPAPAPAPSQDDGLNAQLSHPISASAYPLPHPPKGYKFRPILAPGHEVVLSLSLISGRYYPRLMDHPLLQPALREAFTPSQENEDGMYLLRHLAALEGLLAGVHQSMEPKLWRNGRHIMFKEATSQAKDEFRAKRQELKNAAAGNVDMPTGDVMMHESASSGVVNDDNSMIDPALLNASASSISVA